MKKIALIKNTVVENVIIIEDNQDLSHWSEFTQVDVSGHPEAGIGFSYEDGVFTKPPEPEEVFAPKPSIPVSDLMDLLVANGIITEEQRQALLAVGP